MDNLTTENIALGLVILGYAIAGLRWIAPHTKTKADDEIVKGADKAIEFVHKYSPIFWQIVEALAKTGKIDKAEKLNQFKVKLSEAYKIVEGEAMPEKAKEISVMLADGLSAEDKNKKLDDQNKPDFTTGPTETN